MTSYVENETDKSFDFDIKEVADLVINEVLEKEECPYEAQINILLTNKEGIRLYNVQFRQIDSETDVLSFPNVDYGYPSDFEGLEEKKADYFDPDSGELILGDIIICADKVEEQADSYGHSKKREFAFLVAHSMLHLCGYDHMEPEEAKTMETKQEEILMKLGITREG